MKLGLEHSYATELEGFYAEVEPGKVSEAELLLLNRTLAGELGLDLEAIDGRGGALAFSGAELPEDARPIAQVYAGSQFGHFNPQLGDGRALLLGEKIDRDGKRRDLQLKGSGRTPFSRGGDGLAALGPVLREYLMAEALHALGIPTTRALAVCSTGEMVLRERALPGGIYASDVRDDVARVPLLGRIPVLGALFRHRAQRAQRSELVVYITPRVVGGS
ncbi:MAG: protein adenylyltransferase SelO family protein [Planctomycetota bacterium]